MRLSNSSTSLAVAVAAAITSGASAGTVYVDVANCPSGPGSGTLEDPYCSIQFAIGAALPDDEIVVAPGTYLEPGGINFLGKPLWLHSTGGPGSTTIDGNGTLLHVVQAITGEGPDTILEGFTITGGNANGAGNAAFGGGMYTNANPTIINCVFDLNDAVLGGGGMYVDQSSPEILDCVFSDNTAGNAGGGLRIYNGAPLVTNGEFSGNTASDGGGLYTSGGAAPDINGCSFVSNQALLGGAMYNNDSSPTVVGCSFQSNTASSWGGGVLNYKGNPSFAGCTFTSNTADRGAGMSNLTSSPAITDCVFSLNEATERGGGLYNRGDQCNDCFTPQGTPGCADQTCQDIVCAIDPVCCNSSWDDTCAGEAQGLCVCDPGAGQSNPVVTTTDFLENVAMYGGGVANDAQEWPPGVYGPGSDPTLTGCLFYSNNASIQGGPGGIGGGMWSDMSSDPTLTDCGFVGNDATDWGGAVYSQNTSHPTIDASTFIANSAPYGGAIHARDGSGGQFTGCEFIANYGIDEGGAVYDFDSSSQFTNCTFDDNAATLGAGILAQAQNAAPFTEVLDSAFTNNRASSSGGAIYFIASSGSVVNSAFTGNMAQLYAGGAIRGNDADVQVAGSTFVDNLANRDGGAMYFDSANVTITTSTFQYNSARDVINTYGAGGAIATREAPYGSSGAITDCTFTGNDALQFGGAININSGSNLAVERCVFTQNLAQELGGAISSYMNGSSLLDCTFIENLAWTGGGGLSDYQGSLSVVNCSFLGNDCWQNGGGVYTFQAGTSLMNVLIANNTAGWGGGFYDDGGSSELVNTTLVGNVAWVDGNGITTTNLGTPTITNSVLWDADFGLEIYVFSGTATVNYSTVRGGWAGPGVGNISADPLFVDPVAGDFRLAAGSPCIDAADNTAVPPDTQDLDGDGNMAEPCPVDMDRGDRFLDDPATVDTGFGAPPIVDMGAWEFIPQSCAWDVDVDGTVGINDLLALLAAWGPNPGHPADFDGDGVVGINDFLALLGNWGPCP